MNAARSFPQVRDGGFVTLGRSLALVAIFVAIGPLIGACVVWLVAMLIESDVRHILVTASPDTLFAALLAALILSYRAGIVVAGLTGIVVALFRIFSGRTTLETPIVSALIANGACILISDVTIGPVIPLSAYVFGLVPTSLVAAIVCWLIARRMGLT